MLLVKAAATAPHKLGDRIPVSIRRSSLHLFDADGLSLRPGSGRAD